MGKKLEFNPTTGEFDWISDETWIMTTLTLQEVYDNQAAGGDTALDIAENAEFDITAKITLGTRKAAINIDPFNGTYSEFVTDFSANDSVKLPQKVRFTDQVSEWVWDAGVSTGILFTMNASSIGSLGLSAGTGLGSLSFVGTANTVAFNCGTDQDMTFTSPGSTGDISFVTGATTGNLSMCSGLTGGALDLQTGNFTIALSSPSTWYATQSLPTVTHASGSGILGGMNLGASVTNNVGAMDFNSNILGMNLSLIETSAIGGSGTDAHLTRAAVASLSYFGESGRTKTTIDAFFCQAVARAGGTITDARGIAAQAGTVLTGPTITNAVAVDAIGAFSFFGGVITNGISCRVQTPAAGATKWNLAITGTLGQSYCQGKFRFGSAVAPTDTVDITGSLAVSGNWGLGGAATSATQTGYSTSNVTTDRVINANSTSVDELADVLATLIEDLKTKGVISA